MYQWRHLNPSCRLRAMQRMIMIASELLSYKTQAAGRLRRQSRRSPAAAGRHRHGCATVTGCITLNQIKNKSSTAVARYRVRYRLRLVPGRPRPVGGMER